MRTRSREAEKERERVGIVLITQIAGIKSRKGASSEGVEVAGVWTDWPERRRELHYGGNPSAGHYPHVTISYA